MTIEIHWEQYEQRVCSKQSGPCEQVQSMPLRELTSATQYINSKNKHTDDQVKEKTCPEKKKKLLRNVARIMSPPLLFLTKFKLFHLTKNLFIIYIPIQLQLPLKNSEMYSEHTLNLHRYNCCSTGPSSYSGFPNLFSVQSSAQALLILGNHA